MKTEAIGNGVSQVQGSGVVGRQGAVNGDSFLMMMQAISVARSQTGEALEKDTGLPGLVTLTEDGVLDEKEKDALQKWLAFTAFAFPTVENMETPGVNQELTDAELKGAEDPVLALLLQQWDDLPQAGQELVHLILAALLDNDASLKGEQNTPAWLAELEMLAGAAAAKTAEPDLLMQLVGDMKSILPVEGELPTQSGSEANVAKQMQALQGQLSPRQVQEQLPPQITDQLPQQKLEQLPQHLLERLEALSQQKEDIPVMEKQLSSPSLVSEKGLSPQATALIATHLKEGKPLTELPQALLSALGERLEGMEISREGETSEKARPFEALLTRVEKFFSSLLKGGNEEMGGTTRQLGSFTAEQQFKGITITGDPESLVTSGENESARASAAMSGRAEMVAGTRSFSPPTPPFQPNEVMAQVMERLAMLTRPGVQEMRMRLHPEHLGNIHVKLRNVRGVLSAEILTQNVAVKELLEGQLDNLRQRFQEMNMKIDEFSVLVGDEGQEKGGEAGDSDNTPGIQTAPGLKQDKDLQQPAVQSSSWDGEQHRVDYLA